MNRILALSGCANYPPRLSGENQYVTWQWLADGILLIEPRLLDHKLVEQKSDQLQSEQQLLISAGIHGNETAPIEIVAQIVCQLLNAELPLKVNLLVVFGNTEAIAKGERYLDVDLNRLFNGRHKNYPTNTESTRAAEIEQHVRHFFSLNYCHIYRSTTTFFYKKGSKCQKKIKELLSLVIFMAAMMS